MLPHWLGDDLLIRTFVPSPNLRTGARRGTSYEREATVPANPHLHLLELLSARPLSPTLQSIWPHALQQHIPEPDGSVPWAPNQVALSKTPEFYQPEFPHQRENRQVSIVQSH